MLHIVGNSIFNRFTTVVFFTMILAACSNKAMYQTGKSLDSIARPGSPAAAILGLVTAPLKQNQEEENRKIAEEKRRIAEEKRLRKQAEYTRWFKSLSKEDQCDLLAANPRDTQKKSRGVEFDKIETSLALQICKDALNKSPNNARLQYHYGRVLHKAKKYRAAIAFYEKASRNGYNIASYNLGTLYYELNDHRGALHWYAKAASKGDSDAMYMLGSIYQDQKKYDLAEKMYLKAAKQGDWDAVYMLGFIYYYQKKYDLAEEMYLKAAKQGKHAEAMWNLAVIYQDAGQHAKSNYWAKLARAHGSKGTYRYTGGNMSYGGGTSGSQNQYYYSRNVPNSNSSSHSTPPPTTRGFYGNTHTPW